MPTLFRLAVRADSERIATLSRDLIETGLGWSWTPERVARSIADPDTLVLAACEPGALAGFAIMHFGDEQAHLNLFAVRPDYQRQGIGRGMIGWLEQSLRVAGIRTVHLELRDSNRAARTFYRAVGYRETGIVPNYYRGRESAVQMARVLREPVLPKRQPRRLG